ncbi:AMP-dependent synthetase and ligase [Basidiobolus meristosporus CBS 931.73]|uniref:AMP-dependent synthetase and ligase n=1 Tax=Basidiobolus meristosporus CBS 931.73 TaxID=1314790 RepID=A0A1Y1ZBM8_9FUNG|nr:AMP-dependent synthetase and ligase [Basidiobolus meristosporus CBS 931.73]|eukprot:ORY07702.1 AMP-dependent synthetase and ligase [Basidiobolus meristosporus CBS 931.73]
MDLNTLPSSVIPWNKQSYVNKTQLNPVYFLQRSANVFSNKIAVKMDELTYTYTELLERVHNLAYALRHEGIQAGDRVAYLSPNVPALFEGHFGIPCLRAILVAINYRLKSSEIEYILEHSGSKILFVDCDCYSLVSHLEGKLKIIRVDSSGRQDDPYERFLANGNTLNRGWEELDLIGNEDDTISICYTSGTTGRPKGVMFTYRGAYVSALGNSLEAELNSESVMMWTLPLFHCNGWTFPWAMIAVGGTNVMVRKMDYGYIWKILLKDKITHYNGAPTVQISIANHPSAHRLPKPVKVTVAGSSPSPNLIASMKRLNLIPVHTYGLTETYGPSLVSRWKPEWEALPEHEQARLLARQGHNYFVTEETRVVNSKMEDVPFDGKTLGEVVMRGTMVMKGYFNDPKSTEEAFKGGWFHSGDIAVRHPDGYIELRDRKKDIIISGGENISTIEVEQIINEHPAVLEVAVVAIPDEQWGERPKAFIRIREGAQVTEEEVIAFCKKFMAGYKCPAKVEVVQDFPKTSTGKIQKFVLRAKEWEHLGAVKIK